MTLQQVRAFVRIVELGSLTKAAATLRVAQPALSRQLRLLEAELGQDLLLREPRGVRATPAGEAFLVHAQQMLHAAQAARLAVRATASDPAGSVTVGVPSSLAEALFPRLARDVRQHYPKIRLHLADGYVAELHRRALAGTLDLTILYRDEAALAPLAWDALLREELVCIGAPNPVPQDPLTADELASLSLMLPARPSRLRLLVDSWAPNLEVALELDSLPVLRSMAAAGEGVTILPYSSVATLAAAKAVSVRPLHPRLIRQLVLARRAGLALSPAEQAVSTLLRAAVQDMQTAAAP